MTADVGGPGGGGPDAGGPDVGGADAGGADVGGADVEATDSAELPVAGVAGAELGGTGPTARLTELGLTLPSVVPPVAAYVPAVRTGNYVYTSGQLPMIAGQLAQTGKVGAEVTPEEAKNLARVCGLNALAAAASVAGGLDAVRRVVKVVGFVASSPGFTGQPQVVNGASELFGEVFGEAGVHARSAVGVAVLPLDAPVEIEIVVEVA